MKYHAPTKQLTFSIDGVERAAIYFLHAIKQIRKLAKRPLEPYKLPGALRPDDHAMKFVIDGANAIGIDLGAQWGNDLDVRDV